MLGWGSMDLLLDSDEKEFCCECVHWNYVTAQKKQCFIYIYIYIYIETISKLSIILEFVFSDSIMAANIIALLNSVPGIYKLYKS